MTSPETVHDWLAGQRRQTGETLGAFLESHEDFAEEHEMYKIGKPQEGYIESDPLRDVIGESPSSESEALFLYGYLEAMWQAQAKVDDCLLGDQDDGLNDDMDFTIDVFARLLETLQHRGVLTEEEVQYIEGTAEE